MHRSNVNRTPYCRAKGKNDAGLETGRTRSDKEKHQYYHDYRRDHTTLGGKYSH